MLLLPCKDMTQPLTLGLPWTPLYEVELAAVLWFVESTECPSLLEVILCDWLKVCLSVEVVLSAGVEQMSVSAQDF